MNPNPNETKTVANDRDMKYLKLLAGNFPTISSVTTEIINLQAILHLPKPTEHFLADLHGEHEAFEHVLRNASGNIKRKVRELFGNTLREAEICELCTLIYYPRQKLELMQPEEADREDFFQTTLNRLVAVCRSVSSKYTRSKVRKSLPEEFSYIIEELLHESSDDHNKQAYVGVIIRTIIETGRAEGFVIALCKLIQRLSIDCLHILGDIYDRGTGAHLIMDRLSRYHHWDIQWGNHDILWMGAAAGNPACVAAVLRLSLRYANTRALEEGYGINLLPLATFAMETYGKDECKAFQPKQLGEEDALEEKTCRMMAQMHKAIAVIQFKLEGALYDKHPEWEMTDRNMPARISADHTKVEVEGKEYAMNDTFWPTLDSHAPNTLTPEEEELIKRLTHSFRSSERLQAHVRQLLDHGGMYGVCNSNLLYHASVPMDENGEFLAVEIEGEKVAGKELLDRTELLVRTAYDEKAEPKFREKARDFFWYLWCGPHSPLFDKRKMATFERYFLAEKETHTEEKGAYYRLRSEAKVCDYIMDAFGVKGPHRHIINGHVPVRATRGESPIKAEGRMMVIDGGFAKAYHDTTGIAGYTLVYHSRGFQLVQHEPFTSTEEAIAHGTDIRSTTQIVEMMGRRAMVADTDKGAELREQVADLERLLAAYRRGLIKN